MHTEWSISTTEYKITKEDNLSNVTAHISSLWFVHAAGGFFKHKPVLNLLCITAKGRVWYLVAWMGAAGEAGESSRLLVSTWFK